MKPMYSVRRCVIVTCPTVCLPHQEGASVYFYRFVYYICFLRLGRLLLLVFLRSSVFLIIRSNYGQCCYYETWWKSPWRSGFFLCCLSFYPASKDIPRPIVSLIQTHCVTRVTIALTRSPTQITWSTCQVIFWPLESWKPQQKSTLRDSRDHRVNPFLQH